MLRRDPEVRLLHIRDFARKAIELTRDKTYAVFEADEVLRLALTHLVELVGEAANQVPLKTKEQYPEIPWTKIISMRHRLIHGYDDVDPRILWDTATVNLPELLSQLDRILKPPGSAGH